jgi:hypothetical protein
MTDVTESMLRFRECARHLWNASLRTSDWDDHDDFNAVCALLFRSIVLRPIGAADALADPAVFTVPRSNPSRFLRVVPAVDSGVPILINRTSPASGYWDDPVKSVKPGDVDLRFSWVWDWDEIGHRELEYLEVLVEASPTHPQVAGRYALVQWQHARVVVVPEEIRPGT